MTNILTAKAPPGPLPQGILIRPFAATDFPALQLLHQRAGWPTLTSRPAAGLVAWENSAIALVAVEGDKLIGCIRALTDGAITTYIAELLVDADYRGQGIGKALFVLCHQSYPQTRLDLLSTAEASRFYRRLGCRGFLGYRKSYE